MGIGSDITAFIEIPAISNLGGFLFGNSRSIGDSAYFVQQISEPPQGISDPKTNVILAISISMTVLFLILLTLFIGFVIFQRKKIAKRTSLVSLELEENLQNVTLFKDRPLPDSDRIYFGNYTGKEVVLKKITSNQNELNFYL